MKLFSFAYAGSTIFRHIFYSLLVHTLAVSSLLALPLSSNGNISEQENWYFVHLEEKETVQQRVLQAETNNTDTKKSDSKMTKKAETEKDGLTEGPNPKNKPIELSETDKTIHEKPSTKPDAVSKKAAEMNVPQKNDVSKSRAVKEISQGDVPRGEQGADTKDADKKPALPASALTIDIPAKTVPDAKASSQKAGGDLQNPQAEENMTAKVQSELAGDLVAKKSAADEANVKSFPAETSATEVHETAAAERNNKASADIPQTKEKPLPAELMEDKPRTLKPDPASVKKNTVEDLSVANSHKEIPAEQETYQLSLPRMQEQIAFKTNVPTIKSKADFLNTKIKQERHGFPAEEMQKGQDREKPGVHKIFKAMPGRDRPVSEDIRIVVDLEGNEVPFVSMRFLKKRQAGSQQMDNASEEEVDCLVDTKMKALNAYGMRHVFSVLTAEKAIYAFVVENKGKETYKADILFRIYEGQEKERVKEYKNVILESGVVLKYKFILPYMVFWDDDVFSLVMEDSMYLTKVHKELGLIWKEMKEKKTIY